MSSLQIAFDGVSHHALGGGSYAYKEDYPSHLIKLLGDVPYVEVNCIIQPNSSPHMGTMVSLILTFCLAKQLALEGMDARVVIDLWDNAKSIQTTIDGNVYQKGLRSNGQLLDKLADYYDLLSRLDKHFSVSHRVRMEAEFLQQTGMPDVIRQIIRERDNLGVSLAPSTGAIALRSACPHSGCGLVDKYGIHNTYDEGNDRVIFKCPYHGEFAVQIETQTDLLQFNCQLFNLVLGRFYERAPYGYIEICGSDYAGFWQEQMLWRHLSKPLIIVYTPLIVDWSGSKLSKLSKSLYLQSDAYQYLKDADLEYMLSYGVFKAQNKDLEVLCREVELWVDEPYRLFRCYTVHYVHMLFTGSEDLKLGVIHKRDRVNRN